MRVCAAALAATVLVSAAIAQPPAGAQDVLIRGAEVYTFGAEGVVADTDVLVRAGRIAAIGRGLAVPGHGSVIEASGRPLTPGIFGGLSGIGIEDVWGEPATIDSRLALGTGADPQFRPEFDVTPAFNALSVTVPIARVEGITWTVLTPAAAGSFVAGQGAAVSLGGGPQPVIEAGRSLFIDLGGDTVSSAGGSRAGQYMLLEQTIREVASRRRDERAPLMYAQGRDVLAGYLRGGRIVFMVDRATDIRWALAFAKRHGIEPVIAGGAEAWMIAGELAAAGTPVLLDPLANLPASFDTLGARADNAALLQQAGVLIAFSASAQSYLAGTYFARKARQLAGNAVAHGLTREAALAALTRNPARIFDVEDSRGSIAVGMVADLVLWSGDPLEVTTAADQVWIGGRAIEMRSRQTELRDRYLDRVQ